MKRALGYLALLAGLFPAMTSAYDASSMVDAAPGTLPLILTVPHDGGEFLGLIPVRSSGATVRDADTRKLAEAVAASLQQRTGKRPYIVIAKFSRKYLDANRPPSEAMESTDALPAYNAYHDRIAAYVAEVKGKYPEGAILLDLHGQSQEPATTFRGTRGGVTTKTLLERFGPEALHGSNSISGILASKGYELNPKPGSTTLREDPRFSGGYTVATYGSHTTNGIDAIQLEFGRQHRSNPRLAEDVSDAVLKFMQTHGLRI